jgi:curved DNA-binding protein CbpA
MVEHLKNYYEILGLTPEASPEDIHKTYIKLAKQYHPDHNDNLDDRHMIELNQIYEILSNPIKKQEYDARFKPTNTYDFTKARESNAPNRQPKERVVKQKSSFSKQFKTVLTAIIWVGITYLALYFIVNIIAMYINLPTWLVGFFPM